MQGSVKMAHQAALSLGITMGCLWVALALIDTRSEVVAQPRATIVSVEGATTTYQSIDRDGKVVTVQVPSQSSADIKGQDAQGNVQATVTAIDTTKNRMKVQTPAGQTIVLELSPAALTGIQVGDAFTLTVPASPR
jgi:hypothetical protein